MDAVEIDEESLYSMIIRYGLLVGAIVQMGFLAAVIFMVPKHFTRGNLFLSKVNNHFLIDYY